MDKWRRLVLLALALGALVLAADRCGVARAEEEADPKMKEEDDEMVLGKDGSNEHVAEFKNIDDLEEAVFKSQAVWMVMYSISQGCEMCEQMRPLFQEAAEQSKGYIRFGYLDLLKDKEKASKLLDVKQAPSLVLYTKPGVVNAYSSKRNWYRVGDRFSNQLSARAIKRFAFDNIPDAAVRYFTPTNATKAGADIVLLFTPKSQSSPLLRSLATELAGLVDVGQVSNCDMESDSEVLQQFGVEKLPSLLYVGEENKIVMFDGKPVKEANLEDLLQFVESVVDLKSRANTGSSAGEDEDPASQEDAREDQEALLEGGKSLDRVTNSTLPFVIAVRSKYCDDITTKYPPGWESSASKLVKNGIRTYLVYCNADKGPEVFCRDDLMAPNGADSPWTFVVIPYEDWNPMSDLEDDEADLKDRLGDRIRKKVVAMKTIGEAKERASATIPDTVLRLSPGGSQMFVQTVMASKMLPVILMADKPSPPSMVIALAASLRGLIQVAYLSSPSGSERNAWGIPEDTALPIFTAVVSPSEEMRERMGMPPSTSEGEMVLIQYDKFRFGKYTYSSMMTFLIRTALQSAPDVYFDWAARNEPKVAMVIPLRSSTDGTTSSASGTSSSSMGGGVTIMPLDIEQPMGSSGFDEYCHPGSNVICVIGMFDGDKKNNPYLKDQVDQLDQAQHDLKKRGTPPGMEFKFLWVDASCHLDFTNSFDVSPAALPTVVAFHPKKSLAESMVMAYSTKSVISFIGKLITSKGGKMSKVTPARIDPNLDCSSVEWRQSGPMEEEDEDMDDVLAEIRAEEERIRKEREELEKQAGGKNKKKKSKKKKPKKSKDEL